jgi:hypothetical protein
MSRLSLPTGLALAALTLASVRPAAAITTIAQDSADSAAYSGGTFDGLNGGTGFNAFSVVNDSNNTNGRFVSQTPAKPTSPIGSGPNSSAFDIYNYAPQGVNTIDATRSFNFTNTGTVTTPLTVGSTFFTDFRNTGIVAGGFVGYTLRNTTGTPLFQFGFIGGQQNYFFGNGSNYFSGVGDSSNTDTGLFYTAGGLHTSLTLTAPTTYSFSVQRLVDSSATVFTGTLGTGGAIDRVVFSDNLGGTDSDVQFNNLKITAADVAAAPEPSQMAALTICAMGLGGLMLVRRRQNMRLA